MTVVDTARALMLMDDLALRDAVRGGDLGAFGELELDDDEVALLVAAARGEPADDEVAGFGSFAPPYVPVGPSITLMHAVRYVEDGLPKGDVRNEFTSFTTKLGASGTW